MEKVVPSATAVQTDFWALCGDSTVAGESGIGIMGELSEASKGEDAQGATMTTQQDRICVGRWRLPRPEKTISMGETVWSIDVVQTKVWSLLCADALVGNSRTWKMDFLSEEPKASFTR